MHWLTSFRPMIGLSTMGYISRPVLIGLFPVLVFVLITALVATNAFVR